MKRNITDLLRIIGDLERFNSDEIDFVEIQKPDQELDESELDLAYAAAASKNSLNYNNKK